MRFLTACAVMLATYGVTAAQERASIHRIEYESHRHDTTAAVTVTTDRSVPLLQKPVALAGRVFGYHPYWADAEAHLSYDYGALSTIGYFSYVVDPETGRYSTLNAWHSTPLIGYAHARGVKVVLVVTNFGFDANDQVLGDATKRNTLVATIVEEVKRAGGDGVNIDFEQVRGTQRANLVQFMRDLGLRMRSEIPGAEISMAIPAVDWSDAFDVAALSALCDYLIVMGYDYHWSSAPTAGPVAPLTGETYNVTRSVTTYLTRGLPADKLLLGVPWYGYDWPVADTSRLSTTTGTGRAVTYRVAEPAAQTYGKLFDAATKVPWYRYTEGTVNRQAWYDDSLSLALKYDFATSMDLGGIGIWALSYEGGRSELWSGIRQAFEVTSVVYGSPTDPADAGRLDLIGSSLRYVSPGEQFTLRLFDITGTLVATPAGRSHATSGVVDLTGLPSGFYIARLRHESGEITRRLVISR